MKKIMAVALVVCLLTGTISAGAVSVNDTVENRESNKVTFSGTATDLKGKLMVKVYKKQYGENNTAGFVKLDTVKPKSDGTFEFSVVMPEKLSDGTSSTGEYEIVYSDGVTPQRQQFLYMNTEESASVYATLKTETAENLKTKLNGEFADSAAMVGVDVTAYKKLSDAQRKTVCEMFVTNRSEEDAVKILNECIYSQYITVCPENERVLTIKKINPSYGVYKYESLSDADKKKVADYMSTCKIESYDDISKLFGRGAVLTELSNARKDDIAEIFNKNADLLELNGNSSYTAYLKLSATDKQKTNEKIVTGINGKVVGLTDLKSILSSAMTKTDNSNSYPSSGSTSGGNVVASDKINTIATPSATAKPSENVSSTGSGFNDIDNVEWASEAIVSLAQKGIVAGVADGEFAPAERVTREAFVKMILLASNMFEKGHISDFEDVDNSQWYGEYVACAKDKDIVSGISDTRFGVGQSITRQDMAVMLVRIADKAGISLESTRNYSDFADQDEIADYAKEAVRVLYCANIVNGMEDGSFCPSNSLTRAEAAKVIYDMCIADKKKHSTSSVSLSDTAFKKNVKFLVGVDMISKEDAGFTEDEKIYSGKFLNMAVSLTQKNMFSGDVLDDTAKGIANAYGMIDDSYSDTDEITVKQAAEILVRAVGYSTVVKDGEYWEWASKIGILDGVSQNMNDTIVASTAIRMLKNATECVPAVMDYNTRPGIELLTGKTILEEVKGIYKSTGTVTANNITSLYGPNGLSDNQIKIDDNNYVCNNSEYYDYLGYIVTFYAKEDTNGDILKYAEIKSDSQTTVIGAEEFESVSDDFGTIKYIDGNRTKKVKISATPNVIFNGKYCSDYTVDDFNIEVGDIAIIKNSASGSVDTIIINSYETVILDRVSYDKKKIYNKYSHSGATQEINFEEAEYSIIKDGEEIAITDLKEYDVISLRASRSGSTPYYKLIVSDKRDDAITESYSKKDKTVTSIGYIYDIADSYYDSFNENKGIGETFKLGENQIYLLDAFGRVVAVLADEETQTDEYMYIINAWLNDGGSSGGIKYYDINNQQIVETELTSSVTIGGRKYKGSELLNSSLFDADGNCSSQLVQLKSDEDGKVKKIITAVSVTEADTSQFTKMKVSTKWTYENSSFNYEAFLTGETQILCVPSSGDEDGYYVLDRTMYENDQVKGLAAAVTAYDIDDFTRTDMVVVNYDDNGSIDVSDSLQIFVVDEVLDSIDENDEKMRMLRGSIGNYSGMEFFMEDDELLPDVDSGDALYVSFDKKGNIKYAERVFSLNEVLNSDNPYVAAKKTLETDRNSKTQLVTGWIDNIDLNAGTNENMLMLDGDTMLPIRLNGSSAKVIVYDTESKETSVENIDAVEKGDLAIIRLRYSTVKAIVVIKM